MHKGNFNFMVCWKSHSPLHVEKIQFLKRKYLFSVLYYARNHSYRKLFHIYVYPVCIYSCITMDRETVLSTSKISLLVNLEKTNMNPLHTYTVHTSQSVNILNLPLPPYNLFFLLGFDFNTECSWSLRVIRCHRESVAGLLGSALLVGTGLLLWWLDPVFSLDLNQQNHLPHKLEHYIIKDFAS